MVGAIIGSLAAQGAGTAINAYQTAKSNAQTQRGSRNAADSTANAWQNLSGVYDSNADTINSYGEKVNSIYNPDSIASASKRYQELINQNPEDFYYTPGTYDYSKNVEDFYSKAWQTNSNAQQRALERSAANGGQLYSSGLAANTASLVSQNAIDAYDKALQAYQTDKKLSLNQYSTLESAKQAAAQSKLGAYTGVANTLGNYTGNATDAWGDYYSAMVSNNNAKANTYSQMQQAYANSVGNAGDYRANQMGTVKGNSTLF